jgi:tetratricopeptide (TPR) repeat protein
VPYYITQIYFIQGKFDKVIKEAPQLLNDSANIQKEAEINRMIGESYFNLKDYTRALGYLKKSGLGLNPAGNYVLGYCYYKTNDCVNAILYFEKATENRDTIAQNAWYHIADCHIKLAQKLQAKNAFYSAYQIDLNPKITEDALFSFAKLSYELDFSPYNEAVKGFAKYLKEYPGSPRRDECYNFLINVYSTTKNFELAIQSIESMNGVDPMLKLIYQKLIYFKGVEYFNNNDLANAEKQFRKSILQNVDPKLNALNHYWLAEVSYLRKDYTTAIDAWKKFQLVPGAAALLEYDLSNYALGYAYFQRKEKDDFTNANICYRKFLLSKNKYEENKVVDANIRTADCYFMNLDFPQASDYYKTAISYNKLDVDYCLYQKALCDGLNKNYNDKILELKKIETRYPGSNYLSAALNQIADTYYKNLKDEENAIVYYNKILKNYPNSSFNNNSNAQLGNIYFGRKQDDKAFEYYDKFVKADSKSDEAKDVLEAVKKIFEAKGNVEDMEKYFAAVGNPLSENQIEKATYQAAYDAYYGLKDCDLAMVKWDIYISKFPNGKYINEAQFNKAECAYSKSIFDKALAGYQFIVSKSRSIYTETSLVKASYLLYKDKKYQEALPLFLQLEELAETPSNQNTGKLGAMRCAFYLSTFDVALEESNKVLSSEKLTPQQISEARYIKAKSLYETARYDDALSEFKAMTKTSKNITGAEAYYYIGRIQFNKKEYKEVQKTVTKLIGYEYSNDDWNNKGMLLLADAYLESGNDADAQVILQTLIENKPKQEYMDEAQKRLELLKLKQQKAEATRVEAQNKTMQINYQENKSEADLFDKAIEEIEKQKATNTNTNLPQPK